MYAKILSAIFLIVIIAQVHCDKTDPSPHEETVAPHIKACFEKFNVKEEYFKSANINVLTKEERSKLICGFGCILKTEIINDGKTIHQYLLDGLTKGPPKPNIDSLMKGLNSCSDVKDDECKTLECLEKTGQGWKVLIDDLITFVRAKN